MSSELYLRRKLTLRAHGRQVVFIKRPIERAEHVLMKAFLWALYLPAYPDLAVEVPVGDRYKPDVVAVDAAGRPTFWGESGRVGVEKLRALARRYRDTHLALAKWNMPLAPLAEQVSAALDGVPRRAPVDLLSFPAGAEDFIDADGSVSVTFDDITWMRLPAD